ALAATGAWVWLRQAAVPAPRPPAAPAAPAAGPATEPTPVPAPTATATPEAAPALTPLPSPKPAAAASPAPAAPATAEPGLGAEARLLRAEDLVARGRWPEALAEARAVLEVQPWNARAAALAQEAEAEMVIDECLRSARTALREGDRERALEEVRRGFLVRKNDPRLLAMHREVLQQ
ncbi:MAG TPA: hypothetical protein VLF95_03500, partial [Vicinamibacteria bacterium]|nr:hypothetical protein [Vicinamibacteria bacterium]